MPPRKILIMAMTRMKSGICTAGFLTEPHPDSHLCWARPVKRFGTLLIDDMRDQEGRVVQMGDVITLNLLYPKADTPRSEDWLTDFIDQPVRTIRQLTEQKRADFLARHSDKKPAAVLQHQTRSLSLLKPQEVWARFTQDNYAETYEARLGFRLNDHVYPEQNPTRGMAVTDLKWRAQGRQWLSQAGCQQLCLDHIALHQRLAADVIYISVGLSWALNGKIWPLVIGVHPVPDYTVTIDYSNL